MAPVSILLRASEATCTPRAPVHGECLRACKRSVREVPRFHTQAPMLRERGIAAFSMNKSSSAVQRGAQDGKTQVLFVCLGNICRSPTAEAVFQAVVDRRGLTDKFEIDSCGTGGGSPNWFKPGGYSYHEGDPADSRMAAVAKERGVFLRSRSRPLKPEDLTRFDLILGMDMDNIQEIKRAADFWRGERGDGAIPIPSLTELDGKVKRITQYCTRNDANTVPDPYYGGRKGFEIVLDLLEDACEGLLDDLVRENSRGGRDSARW